MGRTAKRYRSARRSLLAPRIPPTCVKQDMVRGDDRACRQQAPRCMGRRRRRPAHMRTRCLHPSPVQMEEPLPERVPGVRGLGTTPDARSNDAADDAPCCELWRALEGRVHYRQKRTESMLWRRKIVAPQFAVLVGEPTESPLDRAYKGPDDHGTTPTVCGC